MKAIRTYYDSAEDGDDLAGITALEDGRLLLWWGEGQSDIVILTSDEYGNVEKIEHIGDTEDHPVVHFLTACAETGDWGESLEMSKDMLVMYNAIPGASRRIHGHPPLQQARDAAPQTKDMMMTAHDLARQLLAGPDHLVGICSVPGVTNWLQGVSDVSEIQEGVIPCGGVETPTVVILCHLLSPCISDRLGRD